MRAKDFCWIVAIQGGDGCEIIVQLQALGLSVKHVSSLHELATALQSIALPSVVISPVALPDGNWRDLVGLVIRSRSASGVVLCVEHLTPELWWDADELGVLDIIPRPYSQQLVKLLLDPPALLEQLTAART